MFAHSRHQAILHALEKNSPLKVDELQKLLQTSPATLRRDLTLLAQTGKVVRTHGGVMHPQHVDGELSFDRKARAALAAKRAIASAAAPLVAEGSTVFIDAGTTALELGRRLTARAGLTLITNSIPLLREQLGTGTRLIAVGGEVRTISLALVGAEALHWARRFHVDVAFLGASGIAPAEGPMTTELLEAAVKGAVVGNARRVVVLADATKWSAPAPFRYAEWAEVHDLVTDFVPSRDERQHFTRAGTRLHLVTA